MKDLVKLLFSPISSRYQELIRRVFYLETMVEHLVDPSAYIESEEVGFNGQKCRKIIFKELIKFVSLLQIAILIFGNCIVLGVIITWLEGSSSMI